MNKSNNPSAIRSKNEITTALLHLMEQYPYSDITVKQIVLEAGIAHKTFYRNFDSKNDVLDAYINRIMIDYVEQLKNLKNCKMPDILDVIFAFCQEYQTLLILLYNNNLSHILLNKWNTFIPEVHEEIVNANKPFSSCMRPIYPQNKGLSAHFYPYFEGVANIVTSIFFIHTILSDNKSIITVFSNRTIKCSPTIISFSTCFKLITTTYIKIEISLIFFSLFIYILCAENRNFMIY